MSSGMLMKQDLKSKRIKLTLSMCLSIKKRFDKLIFKFIFHLNFLISKKDVHFQFGTILKAICSETSINKFQYPNR